LIKKTKTSGGNFPGIGGQYRRNVQAKMGKEKKGVKKRKPMRYKFFRIVENFFGLQGQEEGFGKDLEQKRSPSFDRLSIQF
jgi:hypothetical protein